MKLAIPRNCSITGKSQNELKNQVKKLINDYEINYRKEFKIYLYSNFLKIKYKNKNYNITILEYNNDLFWYLTPFYDSYLLIKDTNQECINILFLTIKTLN